MQKYVNLVYTLSHRSQLWPTIKHSFSHTFPNNFQIIIIDYFKGLLMTHYLDIFWEKIGIKRVKG